MSNELLLCIAPCGASFGQLEALQKPILSSTCMQRQSVSWMIALCCPLVSGRAATSAMAAAAASRPRQEYLQHCQSPPAAPAAAVQLACKLFRAPLFVAGRYLKTERGVPQVCDISLVWLSGCRPMLQNSRRQCLRMGLNLNDHQAAWLPQSVHACHTISHWLEGSPQLPVQPAAGCSRPTQCSCVCLLLQSPFFKGKERLAESSVEEHITAVLLPAFRAEAHKFITAGVDLGLHSVQAAVAPAIRG